MSKNEKKNTEKFKACVLKMYIILIFLNNKYSLSGKSQGFFRALAVDNLVIFYVEK